MFRFRGLTRTLHEDGTKRRRKHKVRNEELLCLFVAIHPSHGFFNFQTAALWQTDK